MTPTEGWRDRAGLSAVDGPDSSGTDETSDHVDSLDADGASVAARGERAQLAARAVLTDGVLHEAIDMSGRLRRDFARLLEHYYKIRDA